MGVDGVCHGLASVVRGASLRAGEPVLQFHCNLHQNFGHFIQSRVVAAAHKPHKKKSLSCAFSKSCVSDLIQSIQEILSGSQ
jgi:hypothetical protein